MHIVLKNFQDDTDSKNWRTDPRDALRGQYGLFAKKEIPPNTVLVIYVGLVKFNKEANDTKNTSSDDYYFDVKSQSSGRQYHFVIDGKMGYGNWYALFHASKTYKDGAPSREDNCSFVQLIYFVLPLIVVITLSRYSKRHWCAKKVAK